MSRSNRNLTAIFQDTADAIRSKKGSSATINPRDFADEISSIQTGITPTGTKSITTNGDNIDVTEFAAVDVNVPNPSTGTLNIEENGEYDVSDYAMVDVEVAETEYQENALYGYVPPYGLVEAEEPQNGVIFWIGIGSSPDGWYENLYLNSGSTYYYEGGNIFTPVDVPEYDGYYAYTNGSWSTLCEPYGCHLIHIGSNGYSEYESDSGICIYDSTYCELSEITVMDDINDTEGTFSEGSNSLYYYDAGSRVLHDLGDVFSNEGADLICIMSYAIAPEIIALETNESTTITTPDSKEYQITRIS